MGTETQNLCRKCGSRTGDAQMRRPLYTWPLRRKENVRSSGNTGLIVHSLLRIIKSFEKEDGGCGGKEREPFKEGGSTPTFPFPLPKPHPFPSKTFVNGAGRGSGGLAARALLEVSRSHRSRGCRIFCCNVSGFFELLRRNAVPTNLRPSPARDRFGRRA